MRKKIFMFIFGFMAYITIEVLFRGYSYGAMGVCGGIIFLFLDAMNDKISWDMDILLQGFCGTIFITLTELFIGKLSAYGCLPVMWDYSEIPLNYEGIICLPFSIAWVFLSIFGIVVADTINYYIFNEPTVPYYNLFGKTIYKFKEK